MRIRIQKLPFQMLLVLLENAGEVVSREEIKDRLWNDKTHVEFDNSLHVAAAKLRQALAEDPAQPKFLKTIAREGYQFICPVAAIPAAPPQEELAPAAATATLPENAERPKSWTMASVAGLCAVVLLASTAGWWLLHGRRSFQYRQEKICMGAFTNATGKSELDDMFPVLFRESLQESPFLRFIDMPQGSSSRLTPGRAGTDIQFDQCRSAGGQMLLTGQIVNQAPGLKVSIDLWDCKSRRQLLTQADYAGTLVDTVHALEDTTNGLRSRMGEPTEMLNRFNITNRQATTTSLAALRSFSLGDERRDKGESNDAIMYYKMAVDLDPKFALAYARLGAIYSNRADFNACRNYYSTAFRLRDLTTERERLYIMAHYYSEVTGDLVRAIATYKLWASLYPYDPVPENNLGSQYYLLGKGGEAVDAARAALQLAPNNKVVYATLAGALLEAADDAEMRKTCLGPMSQNNDTKLFHNACFLFAFEQGDERRMAVEVESARATLGYESMLNDEAWIAASEGNSRKAHRLFLAATQQNLERDQIEEAALIGIDAALTEAESGFPGLAERDAVEALKLDPSSAPVQAAAALAFARSGDLSTSQRLVDEAAKEVPSDTMVNLVVLPAARAAIQIEENKPSLAIQSLDVARPYDLVQAMSLAPAYYRGLSYQQNHQIAEANTEFRRVISHRSVFPPSLYIHLAELELAHNLQLAGDQAGALQLFDDLESAWQHADSEFPPGVRLRSYVKALHMSKKVNFY